MSRTMKDSGIEWIGDVPEEWEVKRLKDVCMQNPNTLSEKEDKELEFDYVDIGSVSFEKGVFKSEHYAFKDAPSRARRKAALGDLIMSSVRTYLRAIDIVNTKEKANYIYSTGFAVLTPFENIKYQYLSYISKSQYFLEQVGILSKGINYPSINTTDLMTISIVLPPLAEQHLIAAFLDKKCSEIDSLIDLQEQMIEELKAYKQSVITEAVTKGLNPNVPMKDSGIEWIGDVPEGWEVKRLKQVLSLPLQYGANESGIPYQEGLPRYVRITDILDNSLKNDIEKQSLTNQQAEGYILKHNDILFARSGGTVGKSFIFSEKYGLCAFAGYLIKARVNELMEAKFVYYFTQTNCYDEWKKQIFIQSTIQNIGADRYSQLQLPIPPLAEQQAIADYLDKKCGEIDELITIKQQKIESLKEYKKSVIYEYVTGKKEP